VKPIATERLDLDPVRPENAHALWQIMEQPDLRRYQDIPHYRRDEFARRVAIRPKDLASERIGRYEWMITVRATGARIGWVSLRIGELAKHSAEMGYTLIKSARGNGYAGEAVRAVTEAAFAWTTLSRIEACTVPENERSRAVLERLGFLQAQVMPRAALVAGKAVDVVVYVATRSSRLAGQASSANVTETSAAAKPK